MRRFTLSILLALFAGGGVWAAELNIYASGLRVNNCVTETNQVTIQYFLNAPASNLELLVLNASTGATVATLPVPAGDANVNFTKNTTHTVALDLKDVPAGTYKWAIKATAENLDGSNPVKIGTYGTGHAMGRAVAIDKNPESPFYGNVYTVNGNAVGLFGWNAAMNALYSGSAVATNGWGTGASAPCRASVGEDGLVYICDWSDSNPNVRIFNPGDPTADAVTVFGGTASGTNGIMVNSSNQTIHGSISYVMPFGSGDNTYIVTADEDYKQNSKMTMYRYDIGTASTPYTAQPTVALAIGAITNEKIANANITFAPSKVGGWWVSQHRYSDAAANPCLVHISSANTMDFNTTTQMANATVGYNNQASFDINNEQSLIVTTTSNAIYNVLVWDVTWTNNVPSLALKYTIASGFSNTCLKPAIDEAGNIYAVAAGEALAVWALPKAENSCTTPAASSRTITLSTQVTGVTLSETSRDLPVGKSFTLSATVAPATATDKSCTWESSNTSIATVDENGVVKAIAPGSATITVTTTNRGETATCDVTVSKMAGTYNIGGENAHFDHLADACSEICTNGISGNVVLLICDDLEETSNSGIINDTEYSITIKPNAATKRTITFTNAPDNAGPSGHIMIGYNLVGWAASPTKNVVIDGSYNGSGQYLEFQAGNTGGIVICTYGSVEDITIRNCRLINTRTSNTNYAINMRVEQLGGSTAIASNASLKTNNNGKNITIENNYIFVVGSSNTQAIYFNSTNAATKTSALVENVLIRNNEITANTRGVFFDGAKDVTIEGNTFSMPNGSNGVIATGIYGNVQRGTIIVRDNKFLSSKSANTYAGEYGISTILASGGADAWIIENNYFAGMDAKAAAAADKSMRLNYLRCGDSCVVRQNTFYMPSLTNKPSTAVVGEQNISCLWLAGTKNYPVENNIFVSAETEANNSLIRGALNANVKNNVYYHAGGNAYIVAASASKQTWDEFTAGGANPGSKWVNPTFVDAANGDLAISAKNEDLRLTRLSQVLTDINGIERPASTYAGAWEPIAVTGLTLNITEQSIEWPNTYTLTATIVPDNATFKDPVTWTSSNENIATVSSTGVVKALSPGMTTITATSGSVSATCAITVTPSANALHGTYRIGSVANADYASLHAACAAADTYGLSGNVEFLICSDLTETQNSGIINTTDYTLTIRPDADADRTITFTQSTDNEGPSGAFFIGCDMTLTHVDIPTKNVIIDGYAEGGSTRRLTMKIGSGFGSPWGPIIFYGQTTGCAVKNMKIINELVTTTSTEVTTHYAIILRPANGTNHTPTGVRIENNYIENATHSAGQAIVFMGGSNSASYPIGTVIKNNEIVASIRGIFFNKGNSTTIEGNTFRIRPKGAGYLSHAILGDTEVGEITVRNNKFVELPSMSTASSYGMRAITASGGATKWIIENNFFGGIDATATAGNIELTYVRCVDNCEVRHNTFHMPSLTKKPTTSLTSTSPITCLYLANSHDYIVQNNIFVSDETVANNSLIRGNLNENIQNNVLYHAGGNAAIVAGTITYTTFADLPAAYQTANIDQKVTFSSDYHISDTYVGNLNLGVTPIAGITTDIDGNTRHTPTYAGCFEASDWSTTSLYLDETQNNTANIAAAEAANVPTNVTINRRFVVADALYTLILPFDLSAAQLAEAFGAGYKLMELSESYMKTESMMYINFVPASSLTAGKPYLFQTGEDIDHDIVFSGVTIKSTLSPITTELVDMSGVYDPTIVSYSDNNYFLGNNDYLYPYTDQTPTTKGFRAYFHFHDAPANCVARVVFRDDVTTDLEDETFETAPAVQKIIRNGQLIIIRDGIEYNAQGQVIK